MKHNHSNKKIHKKNKTTNNSKRNITNKKRGGGEFDESIKSKIRIVKESDPHFYKPKSDSIGEIKTSFASLGIDVENKSFIEKSEFITFFSNSLNEYIENKREIFFDVLDKLLKDNKTHKSKVHDTIIKPTLCCMSLIEKMKAIGRIATREINHSFNPKNIDKNFLQTVESEKNTKDIYKLEMFLDNHKISRPTVSDIGKNKQEQEEAKTKYVSDLIKIFNSIGPHKHVDDLFINSFNNKIKEIEDSKKREEERKKQEETRRQEEKRKQEETRTNARKILYDIIDGKKETYGLFKEARETLSYFTDEEKKNIIQKMSPSISKILQETNGEELNKLLIDILNTNYEERENRKKQTPMSVLDKYRKTWYIAYDNSLWATMENNKKIVGKKFYYDGKGTSVWSI